MQMFHLAVLNALRMSMLINAQNPLRLPVPLVALVAMSTTAWMASTVDLPFRKEEKEFFAPDHAGALVLSLERLYMRKKASHDVLDSIGIIQARYLSSSHQSLGDYFEGETPWVLFDFPDQVFQALKLTFLYALP